MIDHRQLGVELFNATWAFLDMEKRTAEHDDEMIYTAYASRYHWSQASYEEKHQARGEWQLSRVFSVLGRGEPAVYHAERCLEWCGRGEVEDWDLAFAYEALARAHGVAGNADEAARFKLKAREAGDGIADAENREHFDGDYATL